MKRTASGATYVQGVRCGEVLLLHRWLVRAGPGTRVRFRGDWRDHQRSNLIVSQPRGPERSTQEEREAGWWTRVALLTAQALKLSESAAGAAVAAYRANRPLARKTGDAIEAATLELERGGLPFPVATRGGRLRHHWYHSIDAILEALAALPDAAWIGRAEVERIFGLSRASALRLLVRFGAAQIGRALVIDAKTFRERLRAYQSDPGVCWERERRANLEGLLTEARRMQRARAVRIPLPCPTLPATVRLSEGKLEIEFRDIEDLLSQLVALGQAMTADYGAFVRVAHGDGPAG